MGGSQFDLSLGCLLFSSWANMVLFTLELKEILKYFNRYRGDPFFNKIMVLIALTGDILTVFACLSATYLYMVTHWGEESYLAAQPWSIAGYVIGTGITGAAVQIFLTRMLFSLTKQWIWIPLIGVFICVGLAGAGATAGTLIMETSISSREHLVKWVTVWLSGCVAADTFITAILVVKFQTLKTAFTGTSELLRRLSIAAVRNGSITTTVTIITIVLFKLQPETNTALMLEITIGRVYSLCMLSNLNNRKWLNNGTSGDNSSRSGPHRLGTAGETNSNSTVVRIQKDIEYSSDRNAAIPMDPLAFGRSKQDDAERRDYVVSAKKVANGTSYVEF
ncbi:hypothetical protein C8J57DRAFT_1458800 [Mycena rebaudengoi]|nr:hypothetical protein C8J57DRAFT_1458800 [Mycena rebaudengoi]